MGTPRAADRPFVRKLGAGLGIGLDVTRRRLVYLYGHERFALELLVGCGHSTVSLRIPREETVYVRTDPDSHRR